MLFYFLNIGSSGDSSDTEKSSPDSIKGINV